MNSNTKSFLARIVEFLGFYWKWLFLAGYFGAAAWGWNTKNEVLNSIHKNSIFFSACQIALTIIYFIIFLLLFIGVVRWLRTPVFLKWKFRRGFEKIGFKNSAGEIPILLSCCRDKCKNHGIIYTFKNVGVSIVDFNNKVHQIQTVVNGIVYEIAYGEKRMSRILLSVLPQKYNIPKIISPDDTFLCREPNLLCVGATGSGKSYALLAALGEYALHTNAIITICDYKKSSFSQFEGLPHFYGYSDVSDGIREFYNEFCERLKANDMERNRQLQVLLIDEYGALISAQDKKTAEEIKAMVAEILFMGRSLGMRLLIGVQRADAEHFRAGARDQFRSILAMGNLSREQKQMLLPEYKEQMTENNGVGGGYLFIDGQGIERVKIANINEANIARLNDAIRKALGH
jgi:hypothetical protein